MDKAYGIIICLIIAIIASFLATLAPVVGSAVFAVLIGMLLSRVVLDKFSKAGCGINFTSKKILQLAVVILGFSMNLTTILESGKESLPVIVSTISISLIVAFFLTKLLNLDRKIGILVGVGSSICGGSAIAATAPVIKASDKEIAQSISVIFLFNVLAAIIFPSLGSYLGFSNEGFGLFAGTAVNDTSSVTAAASSWDQIHNANTLELATVVKLTRTLGIIPITLFLSIHEGKKNADNSLKITKLVPKFLILFILASLITTLFDIPDSIIHTLKILSKFFITMAMAAIGLNTDIIHLIKTGEAAIAVGFCCWIFITITSIGMQHLIGIF